MATSNRDVPKELKQFHGIFSKLSHRTGWGNFSSVFDDFLTMSVCALSVGRMEKQYLQVVEKYSKNEIQIFVELFAEMINVLQTNIVLPYSTGYWYDFFGDYYQFISSNYQKSGLGQYFTPPNVCDMMARITIAIPKDKPEHELRINEPCAGSGRMILAAGGIVPKANFYAADLDRTCVKMTALNMLFHNLKGEVVCKNSLDPSSYFFGYRVNRYLHLGLPLIEPLQKEQSFEWQMWQQRLQTLNNKEAIELARKEKELAEQKAKQALEAAKGTLFEEMHQEFANTIKAPKPKKKAVKKKLESNVIHQQTTLF